MILKPKQVNNFLKILPEPLNNFKTRRKKLSKNKFMNKNNLLTNN